MTDQVLKMLRKPLVRRMLALAARVLRLCGRVGADVADELGHDTGRRTWRGEFADLARTERGLAFASRVRHAWLAVLRYLKMPGRRVLYSDRQSEISILVA